MNCNLCFISAPGAVQHIPHFSTRSCPVFPLVSAPDAFRCVSALWDLQILQKERHDNVGADVAIVYHCVCLIFNEAHFTGT